MSENEINKVHVLIRRFLFEVDGVIGDKDKCQKWLMSFAKTLQFQDLCEEPNEYAMFLLTEAKAFNSAQKRKSQMKQVRRMLKEEGVTNPTKAQLEEKWILMYGDEDESEAELYGNETSVEDGARESQGRTGGGSHSGVGSAVPPARSLTLPTTEQLYDFARAENLDEADAREWYEMTVVERAGKDRYGKPIGNWKVTCRRFCEAKAKKRSTQK